MLLGVVVWNQRRQEWVRVVYNRPSVHILGLHPGDVLSGPVQIVADVGGPRYASYSQLWVDGQYADTTNAGPNSLGKYQAQLRLITNHFANGTHTLTLSVADSEDKVRHVIFRNSLHSVNYNDFNAPSQSLRPGVKLRPEGLFEAIIADPKRTPVWAVVVQDVKGRRARTIFGHGAKIYALWDGRDDGGHAAPAGPYSFRAGMAATQKAALENALHSAPLGGLHKQ